MKKHSEIDMVVWWGMLPHVQEHAREQLDTSLTPCKAAGACASLLGGSSRVAIQPSAVLSTYSECVGHACFPYSASCTRVGAVQGASPRALFFSQARNAQRRLVAQRMHHHASRPLRLGEELLGHIRAKTPPRCTSVQGG